MAEWVKAWIDGRLCKKDDGVDRGVGVRRMAR